MLLQEKIMGKKQNPQNICGYCIKNCKQPPESILVSCSMYVEPKKNMELFDSHGRVSAAVARKKAAHDNNISDMVKRKK